jgi:mannose-6-phosphate isomerase
MPAPLNQKLAKVSTGSTDALKESLVTAAISLTARPVERVWGMQTLPAAFRQFGSGREPIGEIWFEHPDGRDMELLVKYLFTSQKLSIQVHPDDAAAQARGYTRGKDEAWLVVAAEPDAVIGIGLREEVSREELRAAALDGSIEAMLDWRSAKTGDVYYTPAGTIHALGPGLSVLEIQQNTDVTYRLYDYGRPRELHLDDGIAVADLQPYARDNHPVRLDANRERLVSGPAFTIERLSGPLTGTLGADPRQAFTLIPLANGARVGERRLGAAEVWFVEQGERIELTDDANLLVAYLGARPIDEILL